MTREEAARILEKQFDKSCGNYRYQNKDKLDYEDALWMAIHALRKLDEQENNKGCAWCNAEYTIVDDEFVQPVHPKLIKFCWHCGRKLKEESI